MAMEYDNCDVAGKTEVPTQDSVRQLCSNCAANSANSQKQTAAVQFGDVDPNSQDDWKLVWDPTDPGFHYQTLGRILRTNVVGGRPVTYSRGVTQTDFNSSVFDRRQQRMDPRPANANQHSKQRDDLSRWVEQNIIWTRQRKAWDSHKAEKKESKISGK